MIASVSTIASASPMSGDRMMKTPIFCRPLVDEHLEAALGDRGPGDAPTRACDELVGRPR
jgi:hypothetical protein